MNQQTLAELFSIDHLLNEEERAIRDVVRDYVDTRIRPEIADWFEVGEIPARELARELGSLGVLGMHLEGYGCQGTSAVAYGLACLELEAGDSGIRSLVSVQGSLAMFAIHEFGSEEQKQEWLPRMAAGDAIGCFGLTEADFGSNPSGMRTSARRDGSDWILDGSKMWITNGNVADVAVVWARTDEGIRGFVVPTDTPGFTANLIHKKMSLRASVTSELVLEGVRLPADAVLPEVASLRGPLSCLNEARYGIVFGTLGAARDSLQTAIDYSVDRIQFDKPIAGLLRDLKQQGLLEDTLLMWGAEFGRTPTAQGKNGRDHNPHAFTYWMAGGGVKAGFSYGESDDFGFYAARDKVHVHDLHATILHLLGLDHERLTFHYGGRDFRLTDVEGHVVDQIFA